MIVQSLQEGTPVQVRARFEASWSDGFVVDGQDDSGYRLRRKSDGSTLPISFDPDSIRPA